MHDDSRRGDDAHLLSLRLALGTILSPKRSQATPSSTTSGTVSPAMHCPHSAIPLTPTHSASGSHPTPSPNPSGAHPQHAHHHAHHHHPHHHHHHHHTQRPDNHQPAMPGAAEGAPLHTDEPHPHIPDVVVHESAGPIGVSVGTMPVAVPMPGNMTPGARARFVETLQSKSKSWDALIHGSWV
ncbi:hypothetical protein GSI_11932 [Ganoderma sinense ZZ0214-1]|uniref:Uncharacterized protein n=1 Tax=Ganoderma sinense ZZ0214-1 TaxID=1077348 RepID=A0A2G8RXG0_9APHY|nr:hypothetical protein GSI_11932 [Ganoderma sinense ZZ0214-1]